MGVEIRNTIEEARKSILKDESAAKFDRLLSRNKRNCTDLPDVVIDALVSQAQGEFSAFGANYERFDPTPLGWVDKAGLPRLAICELGRNMEVISLDLEKGPDQAFFRYKLEEMPQGLFKSGWVYDRDFCNKVKEAAQKLFNFPNPGALTPNLYNKTALSNFILNRDVEVSVPDIVYGGFTRSWVRHRFMEAHSHHSSGLDETEKEKLTQVGKKLGRIFLLRPAFWVCSPEPIIEDQSEIIIIGKSGLLFWYIDKDKLNLDPKIPAVVDATVASPAPAKNLLGIPVQLPRKTGRL